MPAGSPIAVTSDGRATWKGATIPYEGAAPPAVTLRAALADPIGRTGPILEVPAPSA